MRVRPNGQAVLAAIALLAAPSARADPMPVSAEHVTAPGRSVAANDTSDALVLDPANLAFLPGAELRWTWVHCPDEAVKVGCGHALAIAAPLPFGLATALRADLVQPPWGPPGVGVPFPFRNYDYVWLTWGIAAHLGERAAFGISLERAYSQNSYVDGLFGISAGLSWRPDTHVALAAVARDFNRPSPTVIPSPPGNTTPVLDARYSLSAAIRPTGRRALEIGLDAQYWQGLDEWTPGATLGFDIPRVGRIFAGVDFVRPTDDAHRGVVGSAGLELAFDRLAAGGGALFGDGLGSRNTAAEYVTAAIAAYTQPGTPRPQRAVWIRLEDTPSTRGHVALLRQLWALAADDSVSAVTLVLRAEPANSFAHAEELADALRVLRARHKKVLCSLEDGGARSLYVCANADRTVVEPAGGIRYAGLASQYLYFRGLLDKIGVRAEFVRVGPHKTAPEQFTNEHAGPVAAADHEGLLLQQEAVFVRNESLYRGLSEERVREDARHGPFIASEAMAAGLVDGVAFDDEVERATKELVGHDVRYVRAEWPNEAPQQFQPAPRVAILYLDGDIVDGRSQEIPVLDERLVGSYSMAETVKQLREDGSVRAVVLRIESPGGSSLASDVMWRELALLAKAKPLVVSMGTIAASGGYYVASASHDIYALPLTITGSIGVFYGKADVSGLMDKIGVSVDTYKTAPRADAESIFRGFTPDERKELERKVDQFYDTFLDRVSQGRGMTKAQIDAIGRGRVWTGQQAARLGLVDHLGGLREALADARHAAGLPDDCPIAEYPVEPTSILKWALKAVGVGSAVHVQDALPPAVRALAHAVAPFLVFRGDEPLARIEWADTGDWLAPPPRR